MLWKLKFPKERKYPIAFATFLMYIAWHPLGDFIESLFIGWSIIPRELFTPNFWLWWIPFAQELNHSYTFAFFAYFIPITALFYIWFFLNKKIKLNQYLVIFIIIIISFFILVPNMIPSKSVAYKNDIEGFKMHKMEPLNLWMYFHMLFWFVWMIFPHLLGLFTKEKTMLKIAGITWFIFIIAWLSSLLTGRFIYVQTIFK